MVWTSKLREVDVWRPMAYLLSLLPFLLEFMLWGVRYAIVFYLKCRGDGVFGNVSLYCCVHTGRVLQHLTFFLAAKAILKTSRTICSSSLVKRFFLGEMKRSLSNLNRQIRFVSSLEERSLLELTLPSRKKGNQDVEFRVCTKFTQYCNNKYKEFQCITLDLISFVLTYNKTASCMWKSSLFVHM